MSRRMTFLFLVSMVFAPNSTASAQEELVPAHAIGKRVELTVNYKNEKGQFKCTGVVVQVDQKKLIMEEVSKTEEIQRGVPFMGNLNERDEKLFTNVGGTKTVALEFGIVLPLSRIKSCRLAEPDVTEEEKDHNPAMLADELAREINETLRIIRKQDMKK